MFKFFRTLLLPLCLFSVTAGAVDYVENNGRLHAIEGLEINGDFYNVNFVSGNCVNAFDGCDDDSDFTFGGDQTAATAAANAVLSAIQQVQVYNDGTVPLAGCSYSLYCEAGIPYTQEQRTDLVGIVRVHNGFESVTSSFPDSIMQAGQTLPTTNLQPGPGQNSR